MFGLLADCMYEANYAGTAADGESREAVRHSQREMFIGALVVLLLAISIGVTGIAFTLAAEVFPNYLFGTAVGFVAAIGWFVNFGINMVFLDVLNDADGRWYIWLILCLVAIITCVFVYFVAPETKGKK